MTLADSVSTKSLGSASMSGHSMPISSILIGSQLGHLNDVAGRRADAEEDAEARPRV